MAEQQPDNPQRWTKIAKTYLVLSPFGAALAYGLAALQGADTRTSVIISGAAFLLCLGWSLLYFVRGSSAESDMGWINAILRLLTRR